MPGSLVSDRLALGNKSANGDILSCLERYRETQTIIQSPKWSCRDAIDFHKNCDHISLISLCAGNVVDL